MRYLATGFLTLQKKIEASLSLFWELKDLGFRF